MSVQGEFFDVGTSASSQEEEANIPVDNEADASRQRRGLKNFVIPKLYHSISEVSAMTSIEQYVLRFWETEFGELRPQKNRAGNRIYSERDIKIVFRIKELLRDEHYTIEGAKKVIGEELDAERRKKAEEHTAKPIKDKSQIPMIPPPPPTQATIEIKKLEELRTKLLDIRSKLA